MRLNTFCVCTQVVDRVMKEKRSGPTTFEALGQVKNIVEGWCAKP
jgi:hypothetical protein